MVSPGLWGAPTFERWHTHLGHQLQHDFDALHHALRLAPDQDHAVRRVRAALLEQLNAGLGVLRDGSGEVR